jgi:hypothetical protein
VGISYQIVDGIVFTTMEATLSLGDVRVYLAAVLADPAYHAGMPSLVDCRQVTALLSPADLRTIAAEIANITTAPVAGRCAVLAASDVVFGLVRMYEAYSEGAPVEVRAFRDYDEAMAWLRTGS